jgi:class 3 adenylate cyclase
VRLRTQLSLFFGGLFVVVLSVVVAANYQRLYQSLEDGLESQFSLDPYIQLADVERALLVERANALVDRESVLKGVRQFNSARPEMGSQVFAERLKDIESEEYALLVSTYDQMLQVLRRTQDSDGQDLVVLASHDGTVMAEAFNKVYNEGEQGQDFQTTAVRSLAESSFWPIFQQFDGGRGYLVYPNGKPYLYGFASFKKRFEWEGVAVVGKELDRAFLRQISGSHQENEVETDETHALIVFQGQVIASSDTAEALGRELATQKVPETTWKSRNGETFLVKSTELESYYLSDEEREGYEQLGVTGDLVPAQEVGRVFLLRNVSGVKEAAFAGARETLLLGALALLAALLAVPLVANRFTGPIGELSKAMKNIGEGHLEQLDDAHISNIKEVKEAGLSFNQMVIGLRQKKILEHFVPEGTRKEIEALQGQTTEMGGQRWERTIMFSDLRGFTSMSEKMSPGEVMAVLNKYLHVMSRAIRVNGGDINEYIGDAILAVFESPDAAVKASISMNEELLELRKDTSIDALADLDQGIGLHTGPLVEGNIGEENRRLKRAVVGDTVNLAARIQDRSRDGSHTCIFLSQDTKDRLKEPFELVHFGDEMFKGKAEPVPVWEVKLGSS